MGISLSDLGSFAIGAIKEDEKMTAAKLVDRRDELQVDRAMHINNKEKKYERELKAFDEENTKFKAIQSVNAEFIGKGEISPALYGERYLSETNPNLLFQYRELYKNKPNNLNTWLAQWGNDAIKHYKTTNTEDSLEIDRKKAIDEIQVIYKKKLEEARGDSFLISKIIGEKNNAISQVDNVVNDGESGVTLAKEVNDVPKDDMGFYFGELKKIDSATQSDLDWKVFNDSKAGIAWMNAFRADQKEAKFNKITYKDNFNKVLTLMDIENIAHEGNVSTDGYDVFIKGLNDSTRAILATYNKMYNEVWESIDAKELWAKGVEIQDLAKYVNGPKIHNKIYKITESRLFTKKFKPVWGKDKDFMGVLPINIVPLNSNNFSWGKIENIPIYKDGEKTKEIETYTAPNVILTSLYEDFILEEADKLKGDKFSNYNKIQNSVAQDTKYANKFKDYVALHHKEKEKELEDELLKLNEANKNITLEDNNGEISLNGELGTVSLTKLKKEGKLKQVIKKYPWILKDPLYIKWLESQQQ